MQNERRAAISAKAAEFEAAFRAAGALPIEADALLPAETLLDLYGEDIRARAYVTHDPMLGERMMRPDFTVPIVQRHMAEGAEPARYCYNGPIWRKQQPKSRLGTEQVQVGFELFDRQDPARADAEVFALFSSVLPKEMNVITGDVGILQAAVSSLQTSPNRRAALSRHIWRPKRFSELIQRFSGKSEAIEARVDLIVKTQVVGAEALIEDAGRFIGLRSKDEVLTRIGVLQDEASEPSLSQSDFDLFERLFSIACPLNEAAKNLREIATDRAEINAACEVFETRIAAMEKLGLDLSAVDYAGNYGLTSMEYYDGFVFGFTSERGIVATGGRYDALTQVLGNGRQIAAVGGVIRPEVLI